MKKVSKILSSFIILITLFTGYSTISENNNNQAIAFDVKEFTDLTEATKWGNKLISKAKYSSSEKQIIYEYTKNSSPFNQPLRSAEGDITKLTPVLQDKVRKLDSTIFKTSTPESVYVHRLLNLDYLQIVNGFTREDMYVLQQTTNGEYSEEVVSKLNRLMNSRIYRENGYSSTQLVKGAAMAGRPIELKLMLPSGTKAAYIDSPQLTAYPGQQEILLPRGTEYNVGSVKLSDNKRRIIIEAIVFKK